VQNTGGAGARSLGRQYRSPLSRFTTEQSRPVAADTTMSTGVRWNTGILAAEATTRAAAMTGACGPHPDNTSKSSTKGGTRERIPGI
jgi:hypothetical protein